MPDQGDRKRIVISLPRLATASSHRHARPSRRSRKRRRSEGDRRWGGRPRVAGGYLGAVAVPATAAAAGRGRVRQSLNIAVLIAFPEADAVAEAGRLVQRLPELWRAADLSERRRLLLTLLDAVYIDARAAGTIVTIKPKAAFEAVLIGSPALA